MTIFYSGQYVFLEIFEFLIQKIGLNLEISERVFIIFAIIVSNLGILTLIDFIFPSRFKEQFFFKLLALFLYWFNPFTITVSLWHYLAWFVFQAILPYVFIVLYLIFDNRFWDYRMWLSLLIILFFSPGTFGSYAAVIFFIYLAAALFLLILNCKVRKLKIFFVQLLFLVITFVIETYFYLSYLVIYKLLGEFTFSNLTGGAISLNNIIATFKYQSLTTQFVNVIRLVGFSYIYTLPSSYPWIHLFYLVAIGSSFIPVLFILSYSGVYRINKFLSFLFACSIVSIIFSVGNNFPFSDINLLLIQIGGPFFILTNAYYFMIQIYLLAFIIFFYGATTKTYFLNENIKRRPKERKSNSVSNLYKKFNKYKLWILNSKTQKVFFSVLALLIISTSAIPVIEFGEYSQQGPMIGSVKLPNDFIYLRNYFEKNFSSPDYYVLILPLSRADAVDLKIGNGTLPDSSNLFQSIIPYPVIDWALSEEDQVFDNMLTSHNIIHLAPILMAMHVKYVILNPYFNASSWWMNSAPNNMPIQFSKLTTTLNQCEFNKTVIGNFIIYRINNVSPIADIYTEPDFLLTKNLSAYFNLLSQFNYTNNNITNLIVNSIQQNNYSLEGIEPFHVNVTSSNRISANYSYQLVGVPLNGSYLHIIGNYTGSDVVAPIRLITVNSSNSNEIKSNLAINGSSLSTRNFNSSFLELNNTFFHVNSFINGSIRFNSYSNTYGYGFSYFNLYSSKNGSGINLQFLIDTVGHTNYIMFSLYYMGLNLAQRISWGSIEIPTNLTNTTIPFSLLDSVHSLNFTILVRNETYSLLIPINPVVQTQNEGINQTLAEKINANNIFLSNYTFSFVSIHNNLTLNSISVYNALNYSWLLSVPINILKNKIIQPASYTLSKGYEFFISKNYSKVYPVFFGSISPLVKIEQTPSANSAFKFNDNYVNLYILSGVTQTSHIEMVEGDYNIMLVNLFLSFFIFFSLLSIIICLYVYRKNEN